MALRWGFLLLWFIPCHALLAGDWGQFRGPSGNGVGNDNGLPIEWSTQSNEASGAIGASKNVRWMVDLPGRGQSSPVVAGGRVYVTACTGYRQARLHVLCYDSGNGHKCWERQFAATGNTACQPATSMAAPTPVADGKCVWAMFASGDLVCLDRDGNLQWIRALVRDYPAVSNTTGMAASLVMCKDILIVPLENTGESFAAGLDAKTGKNRWKIQRHRANNWVTPLLIGSGTRTEVLLQSAGEITAYDPATGTRRWSYAGANLATIPSPTAGNGLIFVPGDKLIALKSGSVKSAPEVQWSIGRHVPRSASPLVYQHRVFTINSAGVLSCLAAADGSLHWQLRLRGGFWASPVAADDKIYCVNDEGTTFVVAANRGELLATNALHAPIVATPAIATGAVFLRSDRHLYSFSEKK